MSAVAIVGCGALGRRVAALELARGRRVVAVARRGREWPEGMDFLPWDLDRPRSWPPVLAASPWIYYFAPPPSFGRTDPRVADFLRDCPPLRRRRIVLVSTTSVYGDADGAWVDETAPLRPVTERGWRRLAAERQLWAWCERTPGAEAVVLRVAGIYGPERLPLQRLRQGMAVLDPALAGFSSRIHEQDLAAVCVAAMWRGRSGEAYNACDDYPSSMSDYFIRVACRFGLPAPDRLSWAEAERRLSPAMLEYLRESKRVDNRKMLNELGVTLRYPDLDSGLEGCARELENNSSFAVNGR